MAAKPQRPVPSTWFLTTSTAFSAPRGPGLLRPGTGHGVRCVSRPPSDGNRSFQAGGRTAPFPKERESARILAAQTLRRFDPRRQPLRIAAVVASTPFGPPLLQPPRTEIAEPRRERRRNPPRTTDQSGRRFRRAPGGRGLAAVPSGCGVSAGRRLPSLLHTCRVRRHPHDPPGVVRSAGSSPPAAHEPCVATRVLPVGLEALLHRRVRDVGSPFPRCHITILPWVLIPLEATPALVGSRGLPRVRSRRSGRGRSHSGPESVRGGSRSHRWLQTSWGFRRQRTASTWGRGSIPKKGATHTGVWLAVSVGLGPPCLQ
jgi:hypothetical protein